MRRLIPALTFLVVVAIAAPAVADKPPWAGQGKDKTPVVQVFEWVDPGPFPVHVGDTGRGAYVEVRAEGVKWAKGSTVYVEVRCEIIDPICPGCWGTTTHSIDADDPTNIYLAFLPLRGYYATDCVARIVYGPDIGDTQPNGQQLEPVIFR